MPNGDKLNAFRSRVALLEARLAAAERERDEARAREARLRVALDEAIPEVEALSRMVRAADWRDIRENVLPRLRAALAEQPAAEASDA